MFWFAEIAHLDLVTMESTKAIDQHIDEWKLDCHALKYAKFESVNRYFHWHHDDRWAKSQILQKTRSFHFGRSLARQMRIGSYWYSATVRRIMMGGTGGRICLFCDLNCEENLGHLFFTCPAWNEDRLALQSNINRVGIDMESWNGLLADTKAHILLGSDK